MSSSYLVHPSASFRVSSSVAMPSQRKSDLDEEFFDFSSFSGRMQGQADSGLTASHHQQQQAVGNQHAQPPNLSAPYMPNIALYANRTGRDGPNQHGYPNAFQDHAQQSDPTLFAGIHNKLRITIPVGQVPARKTVSPIIPTSPPTARPVFSPASPQERTGTATKSFGGYPTATAQASSGSHIASITSHPVQAHTLPKSCRTGLICLPYACKWTKDDKPVCDQNFSTEQDVSVSDISGGNADIWYKAVKPHLSKSLPPGHNLFMARVPLSRQV